jgi:uncharacterized protein (UPF0332 family)
MSEQNIIEYWIEKADFDIASARDNLLAERLPNAVRDAYFACFHAFSAVLFKDGKSLKKHREVRSALHRDYIRTNKIEVAWGKHYDWLFDNRQKADYRPLVEFAPDQVKEILEQSQQFVEEMKRLLTF